MSCCDYDENIMDITRKRGEIKNIEFKLKYEPDAEGNEVPFDLTGVTFESSIKTSTDILVAQLEVVSNTPKEGRITVITGDTSTWKLGKHRWDIKVTMPNGSVFFIPPQGVAKFTIEPSVSN